MKDMYDSGDDSMKKAIGEAMVTRSPPPQWLTHFLYLLPLPPSLTSVFDFGLRIPQSYLWLVSPSFWTVEIEGTAGKREIWPWRHGHGRDDVRNTPIVNIQHISPTCTQSYTSWLWKRALIFLVYTYAYGCWSRMCNGVSSHNLDWNAKEVWYCWDSIHSNTRRKSSYQQIHFYLPLNPTTMYRYYVPIVHCNCTCKWNIFQFGNRTCWTLGPLLMYATAYIVQ